MAPAKHPGMPDAGTATVLGIQDHASCPGCGRPVTDGPATGSCPACGVGLPSRVLEGSQTGSSHPAPALPEGLRRLLESEVVTGRYEIVRMLGKGAMGAVFEGLHRRTRKPVAIKVLLDATGEQALRFEREGRIMARLSHPCLPAVMDAEVVDGQPVLVMELVRGWTLKADLSRVGRYSLARVREVGTRLLDGLAAAHAGRVIHCDVTPENILLVEGEDVLKILDFGIAHDEQASAAHLTRTGAVLGTPAYMSPEQCLGQRIDLRSDLYSVGIILFEMAVGRLPFTASYSMEFLENTSRRLRRP